MPGYRFPTQDELSASQDEIDKARKAQAAPGQDQAWGSALGALGGGALGLLGLLAGPEALPVTIPLGASLGGSIGGAIGGEIGNSEATSAASAVNADELDRQKKVAALKIRQEALDRLEGAG